MTPFTKAVYDVVASIPKGKVFTYAHVAKLAGKAGAARAVGNALNKNTDFKTVPCHRVVRGNGKMGGYVKGTDKKIALLKKEGVIIDKERVRTSCIIDS